MNISMLWFEIEETEASQVFAWGIRSISCWYLVCSAGSGSYCGLSVNSHMVRQDIYSFACQENMVWHDQTSERRIVFLIMWCNALKICLLNAFIKVVWGKQMHLLVSDFSYSGSAYPHQTGQSLGALSILLSHWSGPRRAFAWVKHHFSQTVPTLTAGADRAPFLAGKLSTVLHGKSSLCVCTEAAPCRLDGCRHLL